MIRLIIYLITALLSFYNVQGQGNDYEDRMEEAIALWHNGNPETASGIFQEVADRETTNWIPDYYVAMVNVTKSFGEQDEKVLSKQLELATRYIEKAKSKSPLNPEILVLEALKNTAWVVYDGEVYGMTYAPLNAEIYRQALAMAPENPRVVLSKAEWDMGSARFMGLDESAYCKDIEKAIELFTTFKNDTPFYPSWGMDRAQDLKNKCN